MAQQFILFDKGTTLMIIFRFRFPTSILSFVHSVSIKCRKLHLGLASDSILSVVWMSPFTSFYFCLPFLRESPPVASSQWSWLMLVSLVSKDSSFFMISCNAKATTSPSPSFDRVPSETTIAGTDCPGNALIPRCLSSQPSPTQRSNTAQPTTLANFTSSLISFPTLTRSSNKLKACGWRWLRRRRPTTDPPHRYFLSSPLLHIFLITYDIMPFSYLCWVRTIFFFSFQ